MNNQESLLAIAEQIDAQVFAPLKKSFVGKDEIIDLLGVSLVARENLFIFGPPGTAKSALVQAMARRIQGNVFDYLLTRFTEPNEIFGPFDIRQLREGNLVTNTEGMLPEATFVFLDELLNANSAILNSLLMALNERIFRRGRETMPLPTLMVVGASNNLPEEEALRALFDRFLLRVNCTNVPDESLTEVLKAGWRLENQTSKPASISVEQVTQVQQLVNQVDFGDVTEAYVSLISRLRTAGIDVSDRRAVKLQRVIAASAVLSGRLKAFVSDLWVLRYIWDTVEQQEILTSLVNKAIESCQGEVDKRHGLSLQTNEPDAEKLAADLGLIEERLGDSATSEIELAQSRDQLAILSGQLQWVADEMKRQQLQETVDRIWTQVESGISSEIGGKQGGQ
jgi:MoxR-like ATPase